MPRNNVFEFKHFKLQQDRCAMKVSTDACIFGAWIQLDTPYGRVLDIGSGTGILSLMVKQRYPEVEIHAVEAESGAMQQSSDNFQSSPFANPPQAFHSLIQHYRPDELYDEVFTNPPYYQTGLRSPDVQLNQAKHATDLTLEELVYEVSRLLKPAGRWHVILPVPESRELEKLASDFGWYPVHQTYVSHRPGKNPNRRMVTFAKSNEALPTLPGEELLYIFNDAGKKYNDSFVSLTKDYYLAF
jgi:tRNA1Val (adenine37-N6)-methyltransferase